MTRPLTYDTGRALLRARATIAAVLSLALLGACGADKSTSPENVAGTYMLVSIAGKPMPGPFIDVPDYKLEYLSGSVTLNANSTYSSSVTTRETEEGVVTTDTDSMSGTYTLSGTRLELTETGSIEKQSGTASGDTVTLFAVVPFVFRR